MTDPTPSVLDVTDPNPTVTCVQQVEVLRTPWWVVRNDDVTFASGAAGRHIVFEPTNGIRSGSVCLAVRDGVAGPEVAMVRVFRYPLGEWFWELPRGFADPGDADGLITAVRELVEETGAVGVDAVSLGKVHPDTGPLRCEVDLVAVQVDAGDLAPTDTVEVGHARWVPLDLVWTALADGTITCGLTMAALLRAQLAGIVAPPEPR